jgi:four helix bundle protein
MRFGLGYDWKARPSFAANYIYPYLLHSFSSALLCSYFLLGGLFMRENTLVDRSMAFSIAIIHLCEAISGHRSLVNQLERSATSIGANIHEANYAQSRSDFISKLQIALKECYETEYWLTLFGSAQLISSQAEQELLSQCGTLRRILISSITTAKQNTKN